MSTIYLYDYSLCIENKSEDTLLLLNDEIAMTLLKKDVITDLIDVLECLSNDDFQKETILKLKSEVLGK